MAQSRERGAVMETQEYRDANNVLETTGANGTFSGELHGGLPPVKRQGQVSPLGGHTALVFPRYQAWSLGVWN